MNGFVKQSYRLGEWLLKLGQLQWYWVFYALKGALVFGLFPATGTVFRILYLWLSEPENELDIKEVFAVYATVNKGELNKLGYLLTVIAFVLLIDLQVSNLFIQSYILHYFLVFLFILVLGTALYVFPIYSRYELAVFNCLKQAFFFFFTNLIETVAMLVGFFLVVVLMTFLPILLVVAGMPFFALPSSWFAYQAMKKVELKKVSD